MTELQKLTKELQEILRDFDQTAKKIKAKQQKLFEKTVKMVELKQVKDVLKKITRL